MSWGTDPELQEMFYGELDERAARLSEGAAELQAGPVPSDRAGAMMREAHTIKGTGRVLGFEAIARVGEVLEELWRGVQSGDLQITGDAAASLVRVTASLSPAGRGDPISGTPELVETFNAFVESIPIEAPPLAPATTPAEEGEVAAPETPASAEPVAEPFALQDESVPEAAPGFEVPLEPEIEADGTPHDGAGAGTERPVADVAATPSVDETADVGAGPPLEGEPEAQVSEPNIAVRLDDGSVKVGEAAAHEPVEQPEVQQAEAESEPIVGQDVAVPVGDVVQAPVEDPAAESDVQPVRMDGTAPDSPPEMGAGPTAEPPPSPPPTDVDGEGTSADVGGDGMRHYRVDLAGLMGAVEHWGRTEAVPVNAGRLYEMINDVAALRQEAHSALGRARGDGPEVSDAIARLQARADALQSESLGLVAVPLTGLTSQLP